MRAVVLVGGEGTRLRPLTYSAPKQMQPIALLPMIERVADELVQAGAEEIVFSLGYKPDVFVEAFPEGTWRGVPLHFAIEPPTLLDTAGAIGFAARSAGIDDTFVAVNGDVLTDIDIAALVNFHQKCGGAATISLTPVEDPSQFGVVTTDDDGKVQSFIEKPAPGTSPTNYINAGVYVLEPSVLELIPEGERVSIERDTFPRLAASGELYAIECDDYWLDTGTPEKYLQANLDFLSGKRGFPPVDGAMEDGRNWVLETTNLEGVEDSLVGAGCQIKDAEIRNSVIGANVIIGPGSIIRDSVIMDGSTVMSGCVISDSVLGAGAVVGKDCKLSAETIVGYGANVAAEQVLVSGRVPQ